MRALLATLLLVPLLDQALKWLLLRYLGPGSISLGGVGRIRIVKGKMWITHVSPLWQPSLLIMLWLACAAALVMVTSIVPSCGWFAGTLLGGALSHGLEAPGRGWICDYVCLRFWPAFNLADLCVTLGAAGMSLKVLI